MSHQDNKQIILDYLGTLRTPPITLEIMDHFISDRDPELRQHIEVFQAGVPGYILEPHDIIAEGNKVVVRFTFRGRHTGELMGFAPTGRELSVTGIIIYEMEGGKIVNHWMEVDMPSLMQQVSPVAVEQQAVV